MNQTTKALRIQTLKIKSTFAIPWYTITISTSVAATVFVLVGDSTPYSQRVTGALSSFYLSGFGTQPWLANQVFPFAASLSVTRRAWVRATALLAATEAMVAGVALEILKEIERGTHGWGVHMRLIDLPYVHQGNPLTQIVVFTTPLFTITAFSAFIGAVFRASGHLGLWATLIGLCLVAVGVVVVVLLTHEGHALGHFVTTQPATLMLGVYPLVLAALFGGLWARLMLRARV